MTVIAGGSRCNSRYFSWHLMRTDRGQTVAVRDVVGLMGDDIRGWFEQMEALAEGGRTKNVFYHFSLSPRAGEAFTPEQEKVAVVTALENLGLEDQPYFVIKHGGKDGRPDHYHCIALRVDLDTGKAISDSHNYDIHMRTATQLEKLFGHDLTERGRGPDGPNPKNYEVQRGKESGINPYDVKAELTELWRQCDTGQAFAAALEDRGYILARGDRRDFVVIDPAGDDHSLARRIGGAKAAEIRARMAGVDRDALPSVDEARALARERAGEGDWAAHEAEKTEREERPPGSFGVLATEPAIEEARAAATKKERPSPAVAREAPPPVVPVPELSLFERVAEELVHILKPDTGPTVAEAALGGDEPVLSPFERMTRDRFEAVRENGGDDRFIAEGIAWRLRQGDTPALPDVPPDPALSPFDRAVWERQSATRDNGGEPVTANGESFWRRAVELIANAYERAMEWVKETAQDFAARLRQERDNNDGRER